MRIVGHIEHPHLKITVFKMDNRFTVKFESEYYEQAYRFYQDGNIDTFNDVKAIIQEKYITGVQEIFATMHRLRLQNTKTNPISVENDDFEVII